MWAECAVTATKLKVIMTNKQDKLSSDEIFYSRLLVYARDLWIFDKFKVTTDLAVQRKIKVKLND